MMQMAMQHTDLKDGLVLEFGVYYGKTIRMMARRAHIQHMELFHLHQTMLKFARVCFQIPCQFFKRNNLLWIVL
jgi:hypothetical protein